MKIGGSNVEVNPNSNSNSVYVNYKPSWGGAFTEPLLGVAVRKYSDSIKTYENNYASVISISDLEKNKTNFITLELDTPAYYENDIFKIRLQ
ncbi:MAG: hypothetical protein ACXWEY_04760 [Bacteroidia bacterium]